ncbi:MAG: serine--tRNA ligase [Schleiferiaceae bacterium]
MIQIQRLRTDAEQIVQALTKRGIDARATVDSILQVDERKRSVQKELDDTLAEANQKAKAIGQLYKEGKAQEANALKEETSQLKEKTKEFTTLLHEIEDELYQLIVSLPNPPQEAVPAGMTEDDNEIIENVGEIPSLSEEALPHWEVAKKYDLIDFEMGVKITGAGFPVYNGKGARLQRALINYFLDVNTDAGFEEVLPPFFVNEDSGFGTGQLPDKEGQMYHMPQDNLYVIPTAEVPVTNIFRDEIVKAEDFPILRTAYTPCFRREAGSYGKDVRGLNRLHQFDKVEIVGITRPEDSEALLDKMVNHVAGILKSLGLPYRVLRLCGGDLGFASAITYDFEVWSAAQKRWLEVSSVSNFETFQSNRLKLRYRGEDKKTHLCHTLNGSAMALPRILAALLENNQTEDGVVIPEVLVPYTRFDKI